MEGVDPEAVPYKGGARLLLGGLLLAIMYGIDQRWSGKPMDATEHAP